MIIFVIFYNFNKLIINTKMNNVFRPNLKKKQKNKYF